MSGPLIVQLALYGPLNFPTLYLYSHGRHVLLAWLYIFAFYILRIIGAAMGLDDPHNMGSQIISSIGLSPLLLSIDGMLHEARIYYCLNPSKRTECVFMALIHVLVATGVAMVGVSAGGLLGDMPKDSDLSDIKVGMVLLEPAWGVLVLWGLWTLWNGLAGLTGREGRLLLIGTLIALLLVEISLVYMLVAEITQRVDLNPTARRLAVRVVLGFLPELLAAIVLALVGILTREVAGLNQGQRHAQGQAA